MRRPVVAGLVMGLWAGLVDVCALAVEILANLGDFAGEVLIGVVDDDDDFDGMAPA